MHTDTLTNLFVEEIRDIRSVEQQIVDVMTRIANGVSVRGLSEAVTRMLTTTKQRMDRLDRIFDEIEPVPDDETIRCPSMAERIKGEVAHMPPRNVPRASGQPSTRPTLSSREVEVLRLIAEGYANKQIANELAISIKTVEKHRQRMMGKLNLHDTAGVTRYAIATGVVEAIA